VASTKPAEQVKRLRIVFMGTPELAATVFHALLACDDFEIVAAVTQPDRPRGRDLKLQPSPVKKIALKAAVPVLQPERAREPQFMEALRPYNPDLMAVAAFGQVLPQAVLDLAKHGCLNVHTSLLPKYRGAAPIQWAILNDEKETGVTIMRMDAGLDTGDILALTTTPISMQDTGQTVYDRLAKIGGKLLVSTILPYVRGEITPRQQPKEGATYAPKIKKQDGQIDWTQPARDVWNRVRALIPWPGAFTSMKDGGVTRLLKIWASDFLDQTGSAGEVIAAGNEGIVVGCGTGALRLRELQKEGGKRITASQFLAGNRLAAGQRLG
jgi:methionyl-tRNA formyltransferase